MRSFLLALVLFACVPSLACAAPLPDAIRQMIETAIASGDPVTVRAVVATARKVAPQGDAEIDALNADYERGRASAQEAEAAEQRSRLAAAGPLELWRSELELGGDRTTGSSDSLGVYASAKVVRPGLRWTQQLNARMDYRRDRNATTVERAVAAYKPQLSLRPDLYAYGLAQYEHDPGLGFGSRYVVGVGLGWRYAAADRAALNLDLGPSLRRTDYYAFGPRDRLAARASLNAKWKIAPNLSVTAEDSLFLERGNTSASSTTALETRLFGPLKARLSYNVVYESDAPGRERKLDTISRASLVYSR